MAVEMTSLPVWHTVCLKRAYLLFTMIFLTNKLIIFCSIQSKGGPQIECKRNDAETGHDDESGQGRKMV